jgi:hypothetical protein
MRTATSLRLLLIPAALLAAACEESSSPLEPPATPPQQDSPQVVAEARWADGYLRITDPLSTGYSPAANFSFNRAGGAITITRPAGTTGRYIATFGGLSALLAGRSAVHVTGYGTGNTYCKLVTSYLASDKVEVRCFKGGNGTPVNANFTLLVTGAMGDRGFAYAHQPTATGYAPDAQGSWNPAGTMEVTRFRKGEYEVVFTNLRPLELLLGHAQVTAVGSGQARCTLGEWGGEPDLYVQVSCHTPAGALVDSKFGVLFARPADHLAYAFADQPTTASYTPPAFGAWNPTGSGISISRSGVGKYSVRWIGADPRILGRGNVQVTAVEFGTGTHCKVTGQGTESAEVRCYRPNGTLVDSQYSLMLGS